MDKIQMVDLRNQYKRFQEEIDTAVLSVLDSSSYINGSEVHQFSDTFASYLNVKHVIPCANGTDALQIALMSLGLKPGDEVIIPAFTYISVVEVIVLLGLNPVLVDVNESDFNIAIEQIEGAITERTKAIIPVHLFGQSAEMEALLNISKVYGLFLIEDSAQSVGAEYQFSDGKVMKTGTIADIGCFSFYPSKNLAAYGDGGCLCTQSDDLAKRIKLITNHGQRQKYYHDVVGLNSRLDTIQAAILNVKLRHLVSFTKLRQDVASKYDKAFEAYSSIIVPARFSNRSHVFHQYTLHVKNGNRNKLKDYLWSQKIPSTIYYPLPIHLQMAYSQKFSNQKYTMAEQLCEEVLSLPIHTELKNDQLNYITGTICNFFEI